ncbi:MAG: YCF48-related protein [Acidobacteriota bacterium]
MTPRVSRENLGSMWRSVLRAVLTGFGLVLIVYCSPSPTHAASGTWTRQRPGSLAWLHSLFFLDQNRGWAAGSRGTLLLTTDGGATWRAKSQPTVDAIRDIHFIDKYNGFLVCERNIYDLKSNEEPRAYLMKTSDGGEQWNRVNLRGANADVRLMRAIFNNTGHGWAFGEGGALYTTEDAGDTWNRLQAPTRYLLLGGTFIDQNNGWLVGAGSTILRTSDGGQTWNHSRLPNTSSLRFNSTSFVNERLGWAVGSGGVIYRTVNGGRSWQAQNSGVTADLLDVKFLDAVEGWAVGTEGTVVHTNNGGLRWTAERSGTPHTLERIFFTDRTHGWAVGFGGTIIKYGTADAPRLRR